MTRTERNPYPAAVAKDRHSRSGLTKSELSHKGGDGAHNWGSDRRRGEDELGGDQDAAQELFELDEDQLGPLQATGNQRGGAVEGEAEGIAQSPTDSMSSLDSQADKQPPALGGRRLSNVSDEERATARSYREGALNKGKGIDLAHIARTSYGVAQSPPASQYIGTSPTKVKGFNFKQ